MRNSNILVLGSTNRHKLEEFTALFKKYPEIEIASVADYIRNSEKLALVETSDHYYDNAVFKARTCNHGCHYPSLADDSGIEVDALDGRPGVRSHRYAIPRAGQTQDQANVIRMLEELKNVPAEKRTARFVCHLVLVVEGLLIYGIGTLEGTIATEAKGDDGFGYDPIFIPHGSTMTLAELGSDAKNKISHRAQAVEHLMEEIRQKEIVLSKP